MSGMKAYSGFARTKYAKIKSVTWSRLTERSS
jgi:hypothetical protein